MMRFETFEFYTNGLAPSRRIFKLAPNFPPPRSPTAKVGGSSKLPPTPRLLEDLGSDIL